MVPGGISSCAAPNAGGVLATGLLWSTRDDDLPLTTSAAERLCVNLEPVCFVSHQAAVLSTSFAAA